MFVIDEEREFMYFISRREIYRTNMEGSGYIVITEMELPLHAINGFTIDQDQRLYFASTVFNGDIYSYDLKRGNGVNLLGHFRKMGAMSLVYTSGWLLWRDWRRLTVCLTPLFEEEGGKGNTTCKPTQSMNKEDIRNIHQDSQKGMVLRKVKIV
ncbi:uncharacterized protein LOC121429504 [Lytechinus variegatus]|uniref:uncharacterized protein LOC121429504 n=1 Tax=Lytechinus variegatus TaxID=7654 RepID=UPI001BB2C680|nr:uncharacterized protein LOC121429504 [Lytechinus variegatus]